MHALNPKLGFEGDANLERRHRKPAVDANGAPNSPRKALPVDEAYGTIF